MKKAAIFLGGVMIVLVLGVSVYLTYVMQNQKPLGIADRTENINVMLVRPDNWRKIAASPVISELDMAILDGSTATVPITAELFRQFHGYTDSQVADSWVVYHSTTHYAYLHLIDRFSKMHGRDDSGEAAVSLILVTPPSEEEKLYARRNDVTLDLTPIAKDGFVFITHKSNPVDSLTAEQIRDIYSGKITNWQEVGGKDLKIAAYQRERNSGSQTAMEQMVMEGRPMLSPISAKVYYGMGGLIDAVAEYEDGPASIGYTYYYYINNLYKNDNIKVLKIDGVAPTNDNLLSGVYPFATNYYAVMRGDEPADSAARKLRDYLISPEGQDLIAMAGYCKAGN